MASLVINPLVGLHLRDYARQTLPLPAVYELTPQQFRGYLRRWSREEITREAWVQFLF